MLYVCFVQGKGVVLFSGMYRISTGVCYQAVCLGTAPLWGVCSSTSKAAAAREGVHTLLREVGTGQVHRGAFLLGCLVF